MKATGRKAKIVVSSDGSGIVSQSGGLLLLETIRATGLGAALSAGLARWRKPRAVHDPGKVVTDLAVALALGGDRLADVAMLRSQPGLFGPVASDPTVSRLVDALAAEPVRALKAIRKARATARERAWEPAGEAAPGADGRLVPVDLDATIVISHSDKEQATPTWKKTFGFHPLTAFADHGPAGGARLWRCCCARAGPGRTPPPTTSRPPGSHSPSSRRRLGGGCWCAPIPAAAPASSSRG